MTWLRRVIQSATTLSSDDSTHVVKLPRSGALSSLFIRTRMTNGATSGRAVNMLNVVDSVEVLANGDRPILSLNSDELLRWQRFATKNFGGLLIDESAAGVQEWTIPLMFGLYNGDRSYFLPLDNFSDLELRVKYSPAIAADGGFATGTFNIQTVGFVKDNTSGLSFQGFLRTLNKYNFSSVASGDEEIELPRGKPYRAIMIYVYEAGVEPQTDISNVKLELNDGAIIYGDWAMLDLIKENKHLLDLDPEMQGHYFSQAAETFETTLSNIQAISIHPGAVATIGTSATPLKLITSLTGGLVTPQGILKDGDGTQGADIAENADEDYYVFARGLGLGQAAVIDFSDGMIAGEPFNSDTYSKIKLILTNAAAGAQVRVSLQELVREV